jgi:hypothetical protein
MPNRKNVDGVVSRYDRVHGLIQQRRITAVHHDVGVQANIAMLIQKLFSHFGVLGKQGIYHLGDGATGLYI